MTLRGVTRESLCLATAWLFNLSPVTFLSEFQTLHLSDYHENMHRSPL